MDVLTSNIILNTYGDYPPDGFVIFPRIRDISYSVEPGDYIPSGRIAVVHYNISIYRGAAVPESVIAGGAEMFRLAIVDKNFTAINWSSKTNVNAMLLCHWYKNRQGTGTPQSTWNKPVSENLFGKVVLKENEKLVMMFGYKNNPNCPQIGINCGGHITNFISGDTAVIPGDIE